MGLLLRQPVPSEVRWQGTGRDDFHSDLIPVCRGITMKSLMIMVVFAWAWAAAAIYGCG
jgi:hypothetical protein